MTKTKLAQRVNSCIAETHDALQLLLDNINKGQQKQLYKREDIKALLDRYGVEVEK